MHRLVRDFGDMQTQQTGVLLPAARCPLPAARCPLLRKMILLQ
ncbi:hypothetical protein OG194_47390 [Streptomyces sp. NBC_01288]|nr:hypothetical protein OG194_47390 [Streptomyces sp. NBC_01288]